MRRPIDLAICGAVASAHLLRTDGPCAEPMRRAFLSQGPPVPWRAPKNGYFLVFVLGESQYTEAFSHGIDLYEFVPGGPDSSQWSEVVPSGPS